jgi:hypothetical protein
MNERIRELADEARIKFSAHWAHQGVDTAVITRLDLKEFAELIVREMCQVINADCELQYSEGVTTNLGGLNQARELIKQHFGVEE